MKRRLSSWALATSIAAGALILGGCSTTETRIAQRPEIYRSLSPNDQALVGQGRIREGMSENAVWLAWGAPDARLAGRTRGQSAETWLYTYGSYGGGGYGGYGRGGYGGYGYGLGYGGYGGGGYFRHHGHSFYRGFGYYDPFYDPFYYSGFESRQSYPYKTVSFQGGRVIGYQFLSSPRY